jgi:hypothetical protein
VSDKPIEDKQHAGSPDSCSREEGLANMKLFLLTLILPGKLIERVGIFAMKT